MASFHKATSPYSQTPVRDFYLDILVPREVPSNPDDQKITVSPGHHLRPDLLSYELYGTPRLWWVFMMRNMNKIVDPIEDFESGLEIFVPSRETLQDLI